MQWNSSTGLFDVVCRDGHREQASADDVRFDRVCGGGGNPSPDTLVSFYQSDSCSSDLLATARFSNKPDQNEARCQTLSGQVTQSVWGVKFDGGSCININDMPFASACRVFQAGQGNDVVQYYNSDSCSSDMVASLRFTGKTDLDDQACANAAHYVNAQVWGVRLSGQCQNVADTTFTNACARFRAGLQPAAPHETNVAFYQSDSCSSDLIAVARLGEDPSRNQATCQRLAAGASAQVWGIRINGNACENIEDTTLLSACLRFQ
jgi:hypothetical protein